MIKKQFWQNVLPAMISFAFSGIYAIVDGIFVGQNTGDAGLAAINLAYPLTALIQATGAGIGMAGAILLAICFGKNELHKENTYLNHTCLLLMMASIILTVFLSFFHLPILQLFGAENLILEYAANYIQVIAWGAVFQILGTGLIPIIRNYHGTMVAMWSMIAGFSTNVVLDWLFISVYGYGTTGAAVATVIGQAVTLLPCVLFLMSKKNCFQTLKNKLAQKKHPQTATSPRALLRLDRHITKEILFTALSPWGLTLSPNIAVVILNKGAMFYGNELAVACYAIISYVICVVQLLLQGIGDGSQPLLGRYYGAKDFHSLHQVRHLAYIFAPLTALSCIILLYLSRNLIPWLFGASAAATAMYLTVLPYFLIGLLFLAFLRITTAYFYATQKNTFAYLLIYGEPLLLLFLVGLLLPRFWQLNGVWLAVPLTQCCLAILGCFLLKTDHQQEQAELQQWSTTKEDHQN